MLSPNGIQAVLFDLDGTLRHNHPSGDKTFLDFAVQLGATDSPEARQEASRWSHYYWAHSPEVRQDLETYKESREEFWLNYLRRHLQAFGMSQEQAAEMAGPLNKLMEEEYHPEDIVLPGTFETLEHLRKAGFRLGIITNRSNPCDDLLLTLGLSEFMELVVIAGSVASYKPDTGIFRHTLSEMGISPEQAIYVGDNFYADIVGACNAGLKPVLIDPEGIYPEANCPVISSIPELLPLLEQQHPQASCDHRSHN